MAQRSAVTCAPRPHGMAELSNAITTGQLARTSWVLGPFLLSSPTMGRVLQPPAGQQGNQDLNPGPCPSLHGSSMGPKDLGPCASVWHHAGVVSWDPSQFQEVHTFLSACCLGPRGVTLAGPDSVLCVSYHVPCFSHCWGVCEGNPFLQGAIVAGDPSAGGWHALKSLAGAQPGVSCPPPLPMLPLTEGPLWV